MIQAKRIVTVGGTLVSALGIGFFMQIGDQGSAMPVLDESPVMTTALNDAPQPEGGQQLEISGIVFTSTAVVPPASAPQPGLLSGEPVSLAAFEDLPIAKMPQEEPAPAFSCEYNLNAKTGAAAMVALELSVPCMPNERFTVHHNGMMFTAFTDDNGESTLNVPALSEQAVFIVSFTNGEGAVASAEVTSLEYYDRAVIQWRGNSGLEIHALEYGADYGDAGHVWANAARGMADAARGEGGFVARYGAADADEALLAEVYTFPTGTTSRGGEVRLSVEAEVTNANCGRDIEAQSIQTSEGNSLKVRDFVLAMPECNAIGDFLVLNNLLNDLKIARN